MKIPLNWLKEFVKVPDDTKALTNKLTMVGHMLDKKTVVDGETVLDLELRGNRADCYSILGIAREVSAIFNSKIKPLKTESIIKVSKLKNSALKVETPLVKRAAMTEVYNVKIVESPKWLSGKLAAYGMDSVNNIVDLTNYIMIETGEPMHAFDLDKVIGETLSIRLAKNGEKVITFQDATINLTDQDLVWAKGDYVLSVAGAIGEKHNSISSTTKNILVEAANYDRANIRKSVYRHNLLTEAGIRHEKDLDPNMVGDALGRFLFFIKKYNWGTFDSTFFDYYPKKVVPWNIKLNLDRLAELGGLEIPLEEIKKILKSLNFKLLRQNKGIWEVEIPTYRTDVTLEEDLIEEILRIYGYEKIPAKVLSLEIPKEITPDFIIQESELRNSAAAVGFNEVISLSFVKENSSIYNKHPLKAEAGLISLLNPPSPDNKNMRITLLPNLIELAQRTIDEHDTDVRLFEIGKIYYRNKNEYKEERKIGFAFYGGPESRFSEFKGMFDSFFVESNIDIPALNAEVLLLPIADSFEINLYGKKIGFGGKISNVYYAEVDLDSLLGTQKQYLVNLWPKYPPQIEDITMSFPQKTKIGDVVSMIKLTNRLIKKIELTVTYNDNYTFRIWYQDPNKTLTNEEVEKIRKEIIASVKNKFGGVIKD